MTDSQSEGLGTYRYKDGREVYDHVYAISNYPGDRTATFSSIQSNAFEENYEMFMGTKGTLIMTRELDAYLFNEGGDNASSTTRVELSRQSAGPVADASASQAAEATARAVDSSVGNSLDKGISYRNEIAEFCSAIRIRTPVRCGGAQAMTSAVAILTGNSSGDKKTPARHSQGFEYIRRGASSGYLKALDLSHLAAKQTSQVSTHSTN